MMQTQALQGQRNELRGVWERFLLPGADVRASEPTSFVLRSEIARSWTRSLDSVDPASDGAPATDESTISRWNDSPLHGPVTDMTAELRRIVDSAAFVVGVTDETGTLLWTCGGRTERNQAEKVNFAVGGRWDESGFGTNAIALALRTGEVSTVFAAEHLVECLHRWVCYCAPIRDRHHRIVGTLDLSTTWDRANPLAMSTVSALASLIEAKLAEQCPGPFNLGDSPQVSIRCLGSTEAAIGPKTLRLSPRQAEILVLLALRPQGYTAGELSLELYGDRHVSIATLKAEVSHLRRLFGGTISRHRYALTTEISCDALDVLNALRRGDIATAVAAYRGPLLPASEAPGVIDWRNRLSVAVREAVLRDESAEPALILGNHCHDDPAIYEHALAKLAPADCRRPLVVGHLHTSLRGWR